MKITLNAPLLPAPDPEVGLLGPGCAGIVGSGTVWETANSKSAPRVGESTCGAFAQKANCGYWIAAVLHAAERQL